MGDDLNRGAEMPIPCPNCGEKVTKTVAEMEADPIITCAACGKRTKWDAEEFRKGLESLQKRIDEFRRAFKNRP